MQSSVKRVILLAALTVAVCVAPAFAQKYEVNPYAGGMWMSNYNSTLTFKNPGIFGLRGGVYVTDNILIEGNGGWQNQFNFSGYNYSTSAVLWEAAGSYNFRQHNFHGVAPFLLLGVGGTTIKQQDGVNVNGNSRTVFTYRLATPQATAGPIPNTLGILVLRNNQTFFNISYGGGIKGERLWGPVGLRADFRGRTIPNFYHNSINSFEATGGILFSWGER
jgi:hypothetical protein